MARKPFSVLAILFVAAAAMSTVAQTVPAPAAPVAVAASVTPVATTVPAAVQDPASTPAMLADVYDEVGSSSSTLRSRLVSIPSGYIVARKHGVGGKAEYFAKFFGFLPEAKRTAAARRAIERTNKSWYAEELESVLLLADELRAEQTDAALHATTANKDRLTVLEQGLEQVITLVTGLQANDEKLVEIVGKADDKGAFPTDSILGKLVTLRAELEAVSAKADATMAFGPQVDELVKNVDALTDVVGRVADLEVLIGQPALEDSSATGLYAGLEGKADRSAVDDLSRRTEANCAAISLITVALRDNDTENTNGKKAIRMAAQAAASMIVH